VWTRREPFILSESVFFLLRNKNKDTKKHKMSVVDL